MKFYSIFNSLNAQKKYYINNYTLEKILINDTINIIIPLLNKINSYSYVYINFDNYNYYKGKLRRKIRS